MAALRLFWHQFYDLAVTTVTVWWRLLPKLLLIQLIGWTVYNALQRLGAISAAQSTWPAIAIFAAGLLCLLIAYVTSLRLVGRELGIRDVVPREVEDDRDDSLTRMLAATLLPFLGIYAAFDYIRDESADMIVLAEIMYGGAFGRGILQEINPNAGPRTLALVVGVLVGIYVVRRGFDLLHERTGWRAFGIVAALLEAFFLVLVIFSGGRLLESLRLWWEDRQLHEWLETLTAGLAVAVEPLRINLPAVLTALARGLDTLWGWFVTGMAEPLAWLAVAALVFGSHVLSLAEMWRKGQPLTSHVLPRTRLARAPAAKKGSGTTGRRIWLEIQELFFGDIDDRYLPTLQSIRIVLRPGLTFLAAYLLWYALLDGARTAFFDRMVTAVGGADIPFWLQWLPAMELVSDLLYQPLFICLLGVTFHRCLLTLRGRASTGPAQRPSRVVLAPAQPARSAGGTP